MSNEGNGAHRHVSAEDRLDIFALVIYIPDPLGAFLDDLRRELIPACDPRAHVSVLPPRTLAADWRVASRQVRALTEGWPSFDIELTAVQVFPVTDVVFIDVGRGAAELQKMHAAMSCRALAFSEPFRYHPHVTVAQEIPPGQVTEIRRKAENRWSNYRGPRQFRAERAALVRSATDGCWLDIAEYSFGVVAVK